MQKNATAFQLPTALQQFNLYFILATSFTVIFTSYFISNLY